MYYTRSQHVEGANGIKKHEVGVVQACHPHFTLYSSQAIKLGEAEMTEIAAIFRNQ